MPLVPAICTQCGASLEVDPKNEASVCRFCNTPFITEKAINHYNITNVTNINAGVVNITSNVIEERFEAANTFLTFKEYDRAFKLFDEFSKDYPSDYRGWWGLIRVLTREFSDVRPSVYERATVFYQKAIIVAPKSEAFGLESTYGDYRKAVEENRCSIRQDLTAARSSAQEQIDELKAKRKRIKDTKNLIVWSVVGLIAVLGCVIGLVSIGEIITALIFAAALAGASALLINWAVNIFFKPRIAAINKQIDDLVKQYSHYVDDVKRNS